MGCNCSKSPSLAEFQGAVGTWCGLNSEGATVTFVLFGEGSFFYGRETGTSKVSIQGPINSWSGGSFDSKPSAGSFCSWHFELEKPVDGAEQGLGRTPFHGRHSLIVEARQPDSDLPSSRLHPTFIPEVSI